MESPNTHEEGSLNEPLGAFNSVARRPGWERPRDLTSSCAFGFWSCKTRPHCEDSHILGGPYNKDYIILESMLGSPFLGNYHADSQLSIKSNSVSADSCFAQTAQSENALT